LEVVAGATVLVENGFSCNDIFSIGTDVVAEICFFTRLTRSKKYGKNKN
jgi:hypothetical protein